MRRLALLPLLATLLLLPAHADKKKKKTDQEPETQTLPQPKELPAVVIAETQKLVFQVSPLSAHGLLTQQVRDALKWLLTQGRAGSIIKLRAFVSGSGDTRRIQAIVSETFTERKLELPVLTVIQSGPLPLAGVQVVLESVGVLKKAVNLGGLAFVSGQGASNDKPLQPVLPLLEQSLARLRSASVAAGFAPGDVLAATCYLSSLDDLESIRSRVRSEFPQAALNFVQPLRESLVSRAECEAVARLKRPPDSPLEFLNPPALGSTAGRSQIALVGPHRLALTGAQLAFGFRDDDARLAFQRLAKTLAAVNASPQRTAVANFYPLSQSIASLVAKAQPEFFNTAAPPASTVLPFEGLPSLDASFGVDVIVVLPDTP